MSGVRVRVGALLVCVVMGCAGWWLATGVMASSASAQRSTRRVREPGMVLSRPGFVASRRELWAGERRIPGARRGRVPVRAGGKLAWRSRADSNTYQAGSGRLVTRIYPYAVNYRSSAGQFVAIRAGLVASHGGYRQQANDLGLRLPAAASGSARLAVAHGGVSLRLLGARGRGLVSGSIERFSDALSGVDFGYLSQNTGLGWEAQVNAASASRGLSFLVRGSRGLWARLVAGGVAFRDRAGRTVWVFKAPTARLASVNKPAATRVTLRHTRRGLVIHVATASARRRASFGAFDLSSDSVAGEDVATGPASPIVWDGQVVAGTQSYLGGGESTGDCYVDSNNPNTSFCGADTNYVGPDDNTLENFDVADNLPSHVQVLQSWVSMGVNSQSSSTAEEIGVWQAATAWDDAATWNTSDGTTSWTPGGAITGNVLDQNSIGSSGDVGSDFYWGITSAMQGWVDQNPSTVDGLIFEATAGTGAPNTIGFDTTTSSDDGPYILVYWEPRMGDYPGAKYDSQQLTNRSSLGVNVATGNLMVSNDDLNLAGVNGLDLNVGRYYNDLSTDQDSFGEGWSMGAGADTYLAIPNDPDGTVDYFDGTGNAQMFSEGSAPGPEISPPGVDAQLSMNDSEDTYDSSTFTLLFRHSGITETFTAPADAGNKVARLTSITDRNGNAIHYAYNSSGQLSSITDSYGNTTTITWSSAGYISQITDPTGRIYKYFQNSSGQLTEYEDPQGGATYYTYDSYGNLTQIKSPAGRITNVTYDAGNTNQVESVERLVNSGDTSGPTWTYQTEAPNACTTSTFTPGPGWTADTVEDPDRHTTIYCTDDLSRIGEVFDANGNQQSTSYTTDGYVKQTTDQLGTPTTFSYSGDGDDNVTQIQDGSPSGGGSGTGAYSAPLTTTLSYSGTSGTANQYLPSSSTDASGNTTSYQYGTGSSGSYGAGEPTSIADGLSSQNTATLTYNANGTIATSTDPDGNETTYSYTNGNLTTVTPPAGTTGHPAPNAIHLTYDSANRVASVSTIAGSTGHEVSYSYNDLDQETQAVYTNAAGSTVETVDYSYDADGNLTEVEDIAGSTTNAYYYSYDGLDRLTGQTLADNTWATYTLDPAGNITEINGPGGNTYYAYNKINQATSVTDPSQSKPIATFTYDATGRLLNTIYSTGVSDDNIYNNLGQLMKTTDTYKTSSGTTTHLSYSYAYNSGGLQSSVTDQAGNQTSYSYDALQRLTQAQTQNSSHATTSNDQYTYDGDGNLTQNELTNSSGTTTTSYAYNPDNEICWSLTGTSSNGCDSTPSGGHTYSYDADGNETSNGNGLTLAYNSLDQTTSITNGGTTTNYSYIGQGQDQMASEGATTIDTEPYGINASIGSNSSTYYTRAPSGQLLDEQTPSGTYDYLYDGNGNVIGLTNSSGQLAEQYSYDGYGNATVGSGAITNPFGYRGGYDSVAGLEHFGDRFYDASQEAWTQLDPLSQIANLTQDDRFVYAGDDPINLSDQSGEAPNRFTAWCMAATLSVCMAMHHDWDENYTITGTYNTAIQAPKPPEGEPDGEPEPDTGDNGAAPPPPEEGGDHCDDAVLTNTRAFGVQRSYRADQRVASRRMSTRHHRAGAGSTARGPRPRPADECV